MTSRNRQLGGAPGSIAALFLARVVLEGVCRPLPLPLVVAMGGLAGTGGFFLGLKLARRGVRLWPLLFLLPYIIWPRRDPEAAVGLALLAVLIWLACGEQLSLPRWVEPAADGATSAVALLFYFLTAAPDVLPADAGEFQAVAATLGVAHPPGYPLYTMAGHLFIRLFPWGSPAYRLNLMSGLLAAGTLVLVAQATRRWAHRLGASPSVGLISGLAVSLALGTATTFWAQATIANVRTPTAFFAALCLYALSRFSTAADRREADRALVLLGLGLGLGLGHHPSLAFVSVFFLLYLVLVEPRLVIQPRRWWKGALVALAAGLLPFAYIPIRAAQGAPFAPPGRDTLTGLIHHVFAQGFSGDMFAFANPTDLPHRLALLPTLFPFQFNGLLLALALVGLLGLVWRDRRLLALLGGSLALHTFVSITYRAPQTVEYMMPAYLPTAVAVGLSPITVRGSRFGIPWFSLLAAVTLWAGLLNGWAHAPSFFELAEDRVARETVEPLLEEAPEGALILADWHWFTPLRYLQLVEGLRPDVEARYVYNVPGEEYRQTWQRRVQEAETGRPVLLTHFYEFDGYITEPWWTGFRVHPRPLEAPTAPLTSVEASFSGVEVVGYTLEQGRFHPGQVVEAAVAWRAAEAVDPSLSLTLRLLDAGGGYIANADRTLQADVAPGEVRFERFALPLYPTLAPGRYQVVLGAYRTTEAGFEDVPTPEGETVVRLAWLEVEPLDRAPFTLHRLSTPFSDGPTLVGVDYDRSEPDELRIYLRWRGPVGEGWRARVRSADGQEVQVALPPLPAGAYQTVAVDLGGGAEELRLGLTNGAGRAVAAAGPWGAAVGQVSLPTPGADVRFVALGEDLALVGVQGRPAPPGEPVVVDLELVGLRPLVQDDHTSVRLMDEEGWWLAIHDSQPAMGAIPTLKWIRGSKVRDRHLLAVPEGFSGERVQAVLAAYEGFRMTTLLPMDERFEVVPLGWWRMLEMRK